MTNGNEFEEYELYADIPLPQALEYLKNWDPKTKTVSELRVPYWNAYTKAHDILRWKNTPENEALFRKVQHYRKHIPNIGVAELNRRLYRDRNILNANRIIASDYKGYGLLMYGISEYGRTLNALFEIYSLQEVEKRLDKRKNTRYE
jgi:hypothetical protein